MQLERKVRGRGEGDILGTPMELLGARKYSSVGGEREGGR